MKIFTSAFLLFLSLFFDFNVEAQTPAVGGWEIFLPYYKGVTVAEANELVYCGTETGMFSVNKFDNSIRRFSKIDGLSDVKISALNYNKTTASLVIGYANGNVDILRKSGIKNINVIINNTNVINKSIFNIKNYGNKAYICCGFGIVVLNLNTDEVFEYVNFKTSQNEDLKIYDVAIVNENEIYAASETGLFKYVNGNFQDPGSWSKVAGIPAGHINCVSAMDSKIYLNYSGKLSSNLENADTMYVISNGTVSYYNAGDHRTLVSLNTNDNKLTLCYPMSGGQSGKLVVKNPDNTNHIFINNAIMDYCTYGITDENGNAFIADQIFGLVKAYDFDKYYTIKPDGPNTTSCYAMDAADGNLWVATGSITNTNAPTYRAEGVFSYVQNSWNYFSVIGGIQDDMRDFVQIKINPTDHSSVYAASYFGGILEFKNNQTIARWDETNTNGALKVNAAYNKVLSYGLSFDSNGALWTTNSLTSSQLAVKRPNNVWTGFQLPGISISTGIGVVLALENSNVWVSVRGLGIYAVKHSNYNVLSNTKLITTSVGNGKLPSSNVNKLVIDKEGAVWAGTDNGFCIFYSPNNALNGGSFDAVIPVVTADDGFNEALLKGIVINDIAVDGGNRKWVATFNAGVFLLSPDGYKILKNFTSKNSPLLNDNVQSVAIDGSTGKVFFGTASGIIAYRGDATEATDEFGDVYAFPNPVKPDFNGTISIAGLASSSEVKITDTAGRLIFQTTSNGGTAIWDGNTFDGKRAQTGVYLVFASNKDGSQKLATKILFVN
jgi:hypothetical protein